ncbi:hypothetical protein PsorP6_015140 [Peronosclerospora sorghi]|uniref:Uncharacterized protein n=1 Tax=Peronosclerospora sorghi TaxID=230839 RepID=A0ACC0VV36_9STRA|nr:hypothetical protein PsorP6_015140 [Peronosclerospora sorghi]
MGQIEDHRYSGVRADRQKRYNSLPFGKYEPEHDLEALYQFYLRIFNVSFRWKPIAELLAQHVTELGDQKPDSVVVDGGTMVSENVEWNTSAYSPFCNFF